MTFSKIRNIIRLFQHISTITFSSFSNILQCFSTFAILFDFLNIVLHILDIIFYQHNANSVTQSIFGNPRSCLLFFHCRNLLLSINSHTNGAINTSIKNHILHLFSVSSTTLILHFYKFIYTYIQNELIFFFSYKLLTHTYKKKLSDPKKRKQGNSTLNFQAKYFCVGQWLYKITPKHYKNKHSQVLTTLPAYQFITYFAIISYFNFIVNLRKLSLVCVASIKFTLILIITEFFINFNDSL